MSFWGRKKPRFSLQRLRELYQTLVRNPLVTERNKPLIIETLRELSEVIVYGDQHHPEYFDFFLEKNILSQLMRIMALKDTSLHIQILQTMSILIENISTNSSIYYLLSNDRVNDIIQHPFDFSDEELMAYYISFLKTLSLKLDVSTVQFFFNHETQRFPLYTEAVKFFNHSEGMVRIGVRTISLAVFRLREERVRAFVVQSDSTPYFSNLVWFLQSKSQQLKAQIDRLKNNEIVTEKGTARAMHGFRDCVDELSDLLYYLADIYALNVNELSAAMTLNLLEQLEVFVEALTVTSVGSSELRVSLYVLGQIFLVLKHPPLIRAVAERLLGPSAAWSAILTALSTPEECCTVLVLLLTLSRNPASASVLLARTLARQSSLLDAILAPTSAGGEKKEESGEKKEESGESEKEETERSLRETALVNALGGLLRQESAPIAGLQSAVLLLRAVSGGLSVPLSLQPSLSRAYAAALTPLHELLIKSPLSCLNQFEAALDSYRQVSLARLAASPELLLPLNLASELNLNNVERQVHRFLVLRDLLCGGRDQLLPLRPASVPLQGQGQTLAITQSHQPMWTEKSSRRTLAVWSTHLSLLEPSIPAWQEEEADIKLALTPPALTGRVVASLPLESLHVNFVRANGSLSNSLPSAVVRLAHGDQTVDVTLSDENEALDVQQALLSRKNSIVDGKLTQLAELLHEDDLSTESTE